MSSRKQQKEQARTRRLELEAQLQAALVRRRRVRRSAATAAAFLAVGAGIALASLGSTARGVVRGGIGPEGVPVPNGPALAPAAAAGGRAVDGITCLAGEQLAFHIHAHLTVFLNGSPRQIPGGIGIVDPQSMSTPAGPYVGSGSCFYWLHTHASDGIIHIESPTVRTYTLGDFFDLWGQPLDAHQVGPLKGQVVALYNGGSFAGSPRQIPLTPHAQIQLEIGSPRVAPVKIEFPGGL
jgi:hypothetical protein